MRRLWLIFAQTATVSLAVLFVIALFKPTLLPWRSAQVTVRESRPVAGAAAPVVSYRHAAQKAMPSVVYVFTSKEIRAPLNPLLNDPFFRRFFGNLFNNSRPKRVSSLGSGVIVSPDGYILTNHHVVASADEIEVSLADGRHASAHVVGSDPDTDLAVLKIRLKNLPAITFGHSKRLHVGDVVLAIGNPFGVGQTVTMGIVSALGRNHLGISTFENFIQTDAAINPGNSGGALVDTDGNLVGINSAIYSRSGGSLGIGFAIPVSLARQVMRQIIQNGSVTRGWVGVEAQDITPRLAESFHLPRTSGALIAGVLRNGPADQAGVRPGDILVKINQQPIEDSSTMLNVVAALAPGAEATLTVVRDGRRINLPLRVGKRPALDKNMD